MSFKNLNDIASAFAQTLLDDVDNTAARSTLGLGTAAVANTGDFLSSSTSSVQDGYFGNIKLKDDTSPSHYLTLTDAENLTADHTLSISVGDADRTLTLGGNATLNGGTHSGTNTGDQNIFSTIVVSGQSNVVAETTSDTLTLIAGTNITITTNATNDEITITGTGGGSGLTQPEVLARISIGF